MAAHRFGNRSVPPMVTHQYPAKEDLPRKPSAYGVMWTVVVMVALFVIGGILYLSTGSNPGRTSLTTGAAPLSEPRPVPQVPPPPVPPVRAQE
jgi:hypothetical protein